MNRRFSSIHARALCHATENIEKVEQAVRLVIPDAELEVSKATGHHGNSIDVLEARSKDEAVVDSLFDRLIREDVAELNRSMDLRIDESCNFYLRVDKQDAYRGTLRLSTGDDAVAIRIKVVAFPARREKALAVVREHVAKHLDRPS